MKIKDIAHWSERPSSPLGTKDAHAPIADGVLVSLSLGNIHHRFGGAMPRRMIFRLDQSGVVE